MRIVLTLLLAVLVSALVVRFSIRSHAPTVTDVTRRYMAYFDSDRDGRVSLHEWMHFGGDRATFEAFDLNDDGFIDAEEFREAFLHLNKRTVALGNKATP